MHGIHDSFMTKLLQVIGMSGKLGGGSGILEVEVEVEMVLLRVYVCKRLRTVAVGVELVSIL